MTSGLATQVLMVCGMIAAVNFFVMAISTGADWWYALLIMAIATAPMLHLATDWTPRHEENE